MGELAAVVPEIDEQVVHHQQIEQQETSMRNNVFQLSESCSKPKIEVS